MARPTSAPLLACVLGNLLALVAGGGWRQLRPSGPGPDGRTAHVAGYSEAERALFVFGGTRSNKTIQRETLVNELWKYSLASDSWEELKPAGPVPHAMCEHVAVFAQGEGALYVHGGGDCSGKFRPEDHLLGDLWRYSLKAGTWQRLATSGPAPSRRFLHAAAFSEASRELFIFGGADVEGELNDLWKYSVDSDSWQQLRATDRLPNQTLTRHTLFFSEADRALLIFGGWRGSEYSVNDLWKYSVDSGEWAPLATSGSAPAPRGEHAAAFVQAERAFYMHGGWATYSQFFDDLWKYSLASDRWEQVAVSGTSPACRTDHTLVYSERDRTLLTFGGTDGRRGGCDARTPKHSPEYNVDDNWMNELWEYSTRDAHGEL